MKNVFLKVKEDAVNNPPVILISFFLATIPLKYNYNSISIISSFIIAIVIYKKREIHFQKALFLPIALYLVMLFSLFWTIDLQETKSALLKEVSLLAIPVLFFILPKLTKNEITKITQYFSYAIFLYTVFYLSKAIIRFVITKDSSVFFYHELVTLEVNAIHVSVYVAIGFFVLLIKPNKSLIDKIAIPLLFVVIVLLSSKNIIVVFLILLFFHQLFLLKKQVKRKFYLLAFLAFSIFSITFFGKIKERFLIELNSNVSENNQNTTEFNVTDNVYNVTIKEAWSKEKFAPNDYFPGFALRVYQVRIFNELLHEDTLFWKGYGLNASWAKIKEKRIQHNLYEGYDKFNFHNQYIQNFAELGVFGFIVLLAMVVINLKNAIKKKDFIHISFAILMISLFLTESFLWRQRGVVFFTTIYCLFNSEIVENSSPKQKNI